MYPPDIFHIVWNTFQYLMTSALSNLPSTENKSRSISLWEYIIFSKSSIFFVHRLRTLTSNLMSDVYSKFQTHEPNSNKGLMWLIYKVNMNSLERQSVELSKFTDIPELFPTMDLTYLWNFNSGSTNIPKFLDECILKVFDKNVTIYVIYKKELW